MDITIDDILKSDRCNQTHVLRMIIETDNIKLFKIWLCNMSGNYNCNYNCKDDNFNVNIPINTFGGGNFSHSHSCQKYTESIISTACVKKARQILTFLLGTHNNNGINIYNFRDIDLNAMVKEYFSKK